MNAPGISKRITDDEVRQAQAVDVAALVSRVVKLSRDGKWLVGLCPFHKEKTPSFKLKDGRFYCFGCGAKGDAIDWVSRTQNLSFVEAVRSLASAGMAFRPPGVSRQNQPSADFANPAVTRARAIWHQGVAVFGTAVESYMQGRGLSSFPESVRALPHYHWFPDAIVPCMVVAIQQPSGAVIGIQLTALAVDGRHKAFGKNSRRTEGLLGAGAGRFGAATEILGLAEGAEKAIAAQELTGVPTWTSFGAARMQSVAIPNFVRELHLFGDDDKAGREAVERTAQLQKHRRIIVRYPPEGCKDWDDALVARRNT